jgi:hypothetical protein
VLYLAIPAHNEVATIGVLLWRLRTVLAEFPREYEVVVFDDASSDETADVAEQYVHAMPVTVLRGTTPIGYAGAVNALVRHIAAHTRYPRRDAMLLLQGDFTDPPGIVPEFARRFEGGADLVVGERSGVADAPRPVRRLFTASGWALRPFVGVEGVRDLTGSMRLMRISALRDLLRTVGDESVCAGDSWTANADLLLRLVPHARRVETVPVEPTYGVRTRDTRRVTVRDALAALRWAWQARGRRAVPTLTPENVAENGARPARSAPAGRRRDEPELTVDRLRERTRDRDRLRGEPEVATTRRDGRTTRDRGTSRPAHTEEQKAQRRKEQREDPPARTRGDRREERSTAAAPASSTAPSPSRTSRSERPPRAPRPSVISADADLVLDDPFAGPPQRGAAASIPEAIDAARARPTLPSDPSPYVEHVASEPDVHDDADTTGTTAESENDETDGELETGVAEPGDNTEGRERKRRRNRRSRRRKSRNRDGAPGSDSASQADGTSSDTREDASAAPEPSPYAGESDGDHASADDDDSGEGTVAEGAESGDVTRARRRGRRGRRGGSRRSRGRGRDEAPESGGDSAPTPTAE